MISAFESCFPHHKIIQLLDTNVGNTYDFFFFITRELIENADFWALLQGFSFFKSVVRGSPKLCTAENTYNHGFSF